MNREKKLIKNTIIITLGNLSTKFVSFLLLPLYTAILSTEEYGTVELINTYVSLLLPLVTFEIEQALFRYLIDNRNKKEDKTKVISTAFAFDFFQMIIFMLIFLATSYFFKIQFKFFILTNISATLLSSITLQYCRGVGDNKSYSIASFITAFITIVLNIIFIKFFKFGAFGMLLSIFIANIFCFIYLVLKKKIYKQFHFNQIDRKLLMQMLKYSLPLIPNALSWWVINASDRIIVSNFLGLNINGIYSIAYKFSNLYYSLYTIYNLTLTESVALHIYDEDSNEFISGILWKSHNFFFSLNLITISLISVIFNIIIHENYKDAYLQIPILLVASFLTSLVLMFGTIYVANKNTKEVAKTTIYAGIINIIVDLVLIKIIGLYAASFSTFVAFFILIIYRWFDLKKYINLNFNFKIVTFNILYLSLILTTYYLGNIYIKIPIFISTLILGYMLNKTFIMDFATIILKKIKKGGNKQWI